MPMDNEYECWFTHLRIRNSGNRAPTLLLKRASPFPWYVCATSCVSLVYSLEAYSHTHLIKLKIQQLWKYKAFCSWLIQGCVRVCLHQEAQGSAAENKERIARVRGGRVNSCCSSKLLTSPPLDPTQGVQLILWRIIIFAAVTRAFP